MSRLTTDPARKLPKGSRKARKPLAGRAAHRDQFGKSADSQTAERLIEIAPLIVSLLQSADKTIPKSRHDARRYLGRAIALLQAEVERHQASRASGGSGAKGLAAWQISRIIAFVEENLSATIRMRDFATVTRLSNGYFSQAFRESFGMSPHAYVVRRRIVRAQEMMVLTDKPLSQIALDCGLADQSHLTRLFRKIVGISPGQWRRQRHCLLDEGFLCLAN